MERLAGWGWRRFGARYFKIYAVLEVLSAFSIMLGTLGLKILLIEDEAATARTLALRTPVDRANQRFGNVCRISAKLLPPPSKPASPPVLTVVSGKRRGSKYG